MKKKKRLSSTAAGILIAAMAGCSEPYEPQNNIIEDVYGPPAAVESAEEESKQPGIQENTEDSEGPSIQEN